MNLQEKVDGYLEKIKKEDKRINAFLYVNKKVIEEAREIDKKIDKGKKKGALYSYIFGVKSNILYT